MQKGYYQRQGADKQMPFTYTCQLARQVEAIDGVTNVMLDIMHVDVLAGE